LVVVFAVYKLAPIPAMALYVGGAVAVLIPVTLSIMAACRKNLRLGNRAIRRCAQATQERLSTALELSGSSSGDGAWKELVIQTRRRHASDIDARQLLPLNLPAVSRWALLVLAHRRGARIYSEYRTKAFIEKKEQQANIRETGKQLAS